ncbi:HPr kinase/phosphatase C-terminal domain-containing protein [soil metagenome]
MTAGDLRRDPMHTVANIMKDHPEVDPTLNDVVAEHATQFSVLGFDLQFETNDLRIENAAREIFGPDTTGREGSPAVTVRLLLHHVNEESTWLPVQPIVREQSGLFSVTCSRATFVAGDTERGVAIGFVSDTVASLPEFLRTNIVMAAFLMTINFRVLGAIHTACVWKNGRSLMLRGATGAGKSTIAYVALRSGFSLLAEDAVFPRREDSGEIALHGLPWTMYLLPDAVRFFPELCSAPQFARSSGETKIGVQVDERFPGQCRVVAPLGPSVFVARSVDGQSRLVPLEQDEFQKRLDATSIAFERRAARESGLWDAMHELPAYQLEIGPDPFDAARLLNLLIEDNRNFSAR